MKKTKFRTPPKAPDPQPKVKGTSKPPKAPRNTGIADKAPYGRGSQKKGC